MSLQVLPAGSWSHASLMSGFHVLSFGDLGRPDMAYVEHSLGAVHIEKAPDVALARKKVRPAA